MVDWKAVHQKYVSILAIVFLLVVAIIAVAPSETGYLSFGKSSFWKSSESAFKFPIKIGPSPIRSILPRAITVCQNGTCDSTTISGGVSLTPLGGTTIVTDKGIYDERVEIFKRDITLDCGRATVTGGSFKGIWINVNGVTVKNCIIKDTGISVNANFTKVLGNTITNSFSLSGVSGIVGISPTATAELHDNLVENNKITSYNGMNIAGRTNTIRANTILAYRQSQFQGGIGISIRGAQNTLSANSIDNGLYGILSRVGSNTVISNTVFNSAYGIGTSDSKGDLIKDNTVYDVSNNGIIIERSSGINVVQNTVRDSTGNGIVLSLNSQDITVTGNEIRFNSADGIGIFDATKSKIEKNTIIKNGNGLSLVSGASLNNIVDNKINSNGGGVIVYSNAGTGNILNNNFMCQNGNFDIVCDAAISGINNKADNVQRCPASLDTKSCVGLPVEPQPPL